MEELMDKIIKEREIRKLIHFTRLENLTSIMEHGILSKQALDMIDIDYISNDVERLDHHEDHVSCSISFPNYKMFYSLRMRDKNTKWVVLVIDPQIILDKECAFFHTNAASTLCRDIPLMNIQNREAFDAIFKNFNDWLKIADPMEYEINQKFLALCGGVSDDTQETDLRKTLNISDDFPTDPQAEVLIRGGIEKKYIYAIIFQDSKTRSDSECMVDDDIFISDKLPAFFGPRGDYEHWKRN